jgi:urease accessory protein
MQNACADRGPTSSPISKPAPEWTRSSNGFATPCSLNPDRVGRDGFLRLQFERRGARTILGKSRFTLPLQAMTPLTLDDGTAYLMLLNPTGGVLGGDHLVTEIIQEAGTRVSWTTPSATRIYRTAERPAILETTIKLGEGATLEYLPDHVIPHVRSALRQSLRLEMAAGSRAIILDSMASGRVAHGERWSFTEMDSRTEVLLRGKPAFVNRTRIAPASRNPRETGLMEEFNYMASLGLFADGLENWHSVAAAMNAELDRAPQIWGGVSLLSRGGCVVRFLARSASDMTCMNKKLWDAARELVMQARAFDHRKY